MIYTFHLTFFYLIAIGLLYYYSMFLYNYTFIGVQKIFNEKIYWNKHIEKPRLLIYVISIVLIWIAFTQNESNILTQQIFNKLLMCFSALFLVFLSHTDVFIKTLSNKKNNRKPKIILINNSLDAQTITDFFIKKKWFRGNNVDTNISNLLNYKLEEIEEKSIICSFSKQIQLGKILFQLKDIGRFNDTQLKDIYQSDLIITSKGDSIKGAYSFHKNKLKKNLYNDDEINLKNYF